jgi:hypothetical protein
MCHGTAAAVPWFFLSLADDDFERVWIGERDKWIRLRDPEVKREASMATSTRGAGGAVYGAGVVGGGNG